MDKELTTIREFVTFAHEMVKAKSVKNMYRIVSEPTTLTSKQITEIKQVFSAYFCNVSEWKNFKGKITYKIGEISMTQLEAACKSSDDMKVFSEYMNTFHSIYFDIRKNLVDFVGKLGLEENSPEALFATNIINEIGGELIDTIKSGGDVKDIATLMPKMFEIVKSGKLLSMFERLKDGSVKFSKIIKAFGHLVEQYENEQNVQLETSTVTTSLTD